MDNQNWIHKSLDNYISGVFMDFADQITEELEKQGIPIEEFAKTWELSTEEFLYLLNKPWKDSMGLTYILGFAKSLGLKVTILAYNDNDTEKQHGPIFSDVFKKCWEKENYPRDFLKYSFELGGDDDDD